MGVERIYAQLGDRIAALRKQRGLTQDDVAGRAGVSANYLARTEGAFHRANLAKIEAIAEALEVSVADLFSEAPVARTAGKVPAALLAALERLSRGDQRMLLLFARRLGEATPRAARRRGQ